MANIDFGITRKIIRKVRSVCKHDKYKCLQHSAELSHKSTIRDNGKNMTKIS